MILKVGKNFLELKIGLDFGKGIFNCCYCFAIDYNKTKDEMIYNPDVRFYFGKDIMFIQIINAVNFYSTD
ncbi:MAG: hypothetical protein ABIL76_02340 [candidate division WOR-3 bacterium]